MAVQTFRYLFPAGVPQGPDRVFSSWTPDRAFTEREGRQADRAPAQSPRTRVRGWFRWQSRTRTPRTGRQRGKARVRLSRNNGLYLTEKAEVRCFKSFIAVNLIVFSDNQSGTTPITNFSGTNPIYRLSRESSTLSPAKK